MLIDRLNERIQEVKNYHPVFVENPLKGITRKDENLH